MLFLFLRYFHVYSNFFYVDKQFDKKAKLNFKTHDVTDWIASINNKNIVQHLETQRQSGNEIWSVYKTYFEKYFYSKIMQKRRQEYQFQTFCFVFFQKALYNVKTSKWSAPKF